MSEEKVKNEQIILHDFFIKFYQSGGKLIMNELLQFILIIAGCSIISNFLFMILIIQYKLALRLECIEISWYGLDRLQTTSLSFCQSEFQLLRSHYYAQVSIMSITVRKIVEFLMLINPMNLCKINIECLTTLLALSNANTV